MTEEQICDLWAGIKPYFDKHNIESAAIKFVDVLMDHNYEEALRDSVSFDDDLDSAIRYCFENWADELEELDFDNEGFEDDR
jgi:hypothetical protein